MDSPICRQGDAFEIICDQCIVECDYCDVAQLAPRCISAVEHSTSPGGIVTIEELEINQGYWRASNSSTKIFACYNADACVGGITGEEDFCANGYEGPCERRPYKPYTETPSQTGHC